MKITDISLGFKKNETIHCGLSRGDYPFFKSIRLKDNTNTKVIVHCTEAERRLTPESVIREFVGDSKIVYEIEKKTNVRSSKIIEVKSNKDKFVEYLRVNNIDYDDGIFEKLKMIEDELDVGSSTNCRSFTLLKMSLRGAIGIKEGTGRDDFEIDFTKYADGLIAFTGNIGSGKSTTLENCHPYARLLSRSGKLQDHFYLKDSYRKLIYVDDEGTYYSIEILIDGKTKNGKVKYLVSAGKDINDLEPIPECDGNSDTYEKWVDDTFGPIELFLRTCFFAKEATKGIPDIAETTKGQKKELFTSLIGIDGLGRISEASKKISSALSREMDSIDARIEEIDFDSIEKNYIETLEKDRELQGNLKEQKTYLKAILKESEAKKVEAESSIPNTETLERMKSMFAEQSKQKRTIETYELKKAKYEDIKEVFSVIENKRNSLTELKGEKMSKELKFEKGKVKLDEIKSSISNLKSNIKAFKESHILALTKSVCPTCGKPLEEHKEEELKDEIKENKSALKKLERELEKAEKSLEETKPVVDALESEYVESKKKIDAETNELKEIEATVYGYNLKDIEKEEAEYTFVKSFFDDEKYHKLCEDISKLEAEIKKRTGNARSEIEKLESLIAESESQLTHVEFDLDHINLEIGNYEAKLEMLNTDREIQKKLKADFKRKSIEVEQYDIITKAFSKNGIQALELEAMAPEIAGITNSILSSAYGDRFKISFETLREGSNHNLIEDFTIMVEDTSTGTSRPLEWLSSGETVWIKEALYNAFTIERQRTTGFTFKTRFLDESDGSLDSSARMKYLNMIESAHREGDVNHTVIITHSQELKDLIPQQIHFSRD